MSTKKVAFFNEDPEDTLVSFSIDDSDPLEEWEPETAVANLPEEEAIEGVIGESFFAYDQDEVMDACAVIGENDTATAVFMRHSNSTTYEKVSNEFIGGKPPVRPGH